MTSLSSHLSISSIFRLLPKSVRRHRYYLGFLSLLSSMLFWISWPPNHLALLLFGALVPLLCIERHIEQYRYNRPYWTFYKYTYLTLFLWNLTTTWWVAHATVAGAVFMLFVNTFCMSLPLPLFQFTSRHLGRCMGYLSLLTYWVSMEHLHLQWEFSFPWLNLGNGFAGWPEWVQWYAYTGALGGTVWVIVANLLLCHFLCSKNTTTRRWFGGVVSCWVTLPILCSYHTYLHYKDNGREVEIVVMQPNIDPYTGKFANTEEVLSMQERIEHFIQLSETQLTANTQFLVWPEVAIDGLFDEKILNTYPIIDQLVSFSKPYPQLSTLVGLNSLISYEKVKATKTARFSNRYGYYDVFNTALFVGNQGKLGTYHKSKLVPGVEIVPYLYSLDIPRVLTPGSESRLSSLGRQNHASVFCNKTGVCIAPTICYESVYGDYLTKFVCGGASLIFSITIDGWWGKTPGYQQHFLYTRLRAIESRRSIARSALKGVSAFINQRGDILKATQYEDQAAIRCTLQANTTLTFYVRHSDFVANTALWTALLLIIGAIVSKIFPRNMQRWCTCSIT